jgi:hypothetical protein
MALPKIVVSWVRRCGRLGGEGGVQRCESELELVRTTAASIERTVFSGASPNRSSAALVIAVLRSSRY